MAPAPRDDEGCSPAAFLGSIQIKRSTPDLFEPSVGSLSRYVDEVIEALVRTNR